MEKKKDATFDMIKNLTTEVTGLKTEINGLKSGTSSLKSEINDVKTEMNRRFDEVDKRFEQVDKRFDEVDKRFDTLELNVDNPTSESRSYFKRLEDRLDTHEFVIKKLSYIANVHDGQIAEIQETLK